MKAGRSGVGEGATGEALYWWLAIRKVPPVQQENISFADCCTKMRGGGSKSGRHLDVVQQSRSRRKEAIECNGKVEKHSLVGNFQMKPS